MNELKISRLHTRVGDNTNEMNKLIAMGVDGIISDYPDLFVHIKNRTSYK